MQDDSYKSTQEKINAHLVRLSNKEEWGLPDWEDLMTIIDEVNHDPDPLKKRYVRRLYWALKDLIRVMYYNSEKLLSIDESSRTLSYKDHRAYVVMTEFWPIPFTVPRTVHIADEQTFNELYRGKPVASFNENENNQPFRKLQQYAKVIPLAKRTKRHIAADRQAEIARRTGSETEEQKLDQLFEGFSIPYPGHPSFEDFIDEIKSVTALETKSITPLRPSDKTQEKKTLIEWFAMPSKYTKIMGLLIEKGYCQPGTHVWIDQSSGFKTSVANLIKHLHAQGFYTDNSIPTNEQIVVIAKETFGIVMGIDTAKKAEVPTSATHNFSFIGPASTY